MYQFKINKNILSISLSVIIFLLLIISSYYFSRNIKLTKTISNLSNQISTLKELNIKNESLCVQNEPQEEIVKKNEYNFGFINTYFNPKYNITLQYNKDVPRNELESILFEDENIIKILIPAKEKSQNIINCDDYTGNTKCYEFNNIKYFENTNKVTILENNFKNFEDAIADLITKNGGDMNYCNLQIDDYGKNKKATLRLSENFIPTEEEVKTWIETSGDKSGAYSNEQFAQAEKSKKLCSKYAQSNMPYVNYFIYNKNRKDIFVYFEFNFAVENTYIDPESINF